MDYKGILESFEEVVNVEEQVNWLVYKENTTLHPTTPAETWIVEGDQIDTIEKEANFCDPELLKQVLHLKNFLSQLKENELSRARSRSNPFESIKGGIFQNRAAMKMANIDAIFDCIFTYPKTKSGATAVNQDDVLYFADVCGGPGGFSEYILWRKKWEAKGFGFTLKCSCDFCLDDFLVAPSECLDLHYGVNGIHGNGDIYDTSNITAFAQYVNSQTGGLGVHVAVADGGFSVDGNENLQEVLSKQIYLCQCLMALCILREGGHFLCKLFDLYTPFSAGLVYLMRSCFEQVSIHKPNTSRPANSERYLVCKWRRKDVSDVRNFLFTVNRKFNLLKAAGTKKDIVQLVPSDILKADDSFIDYFTQSNNSLCQRQIYALAKIAVYCEDSTLLEHRQKELRLQCLELWRVPDKIRCVPSRVSTPAEDIENMLTDKDILYQRIRQLLNFSELTDQNNSLADRVFAVSGLEFESGMRTLFLGLGRREVFYWDFVEKLWKKSSVNLEMPRYTLLYGELIDCREGSAGSQDCPLPVLHVIDALYISGLNVSFFPLTERRRQISRLAKSVNKPSRRELARIKLKPQFPLEMAESILQRCFAAKESSSHDGNCVYHDQEDCSFTPTGIIMYRSSSTLPTSHFFGCFKSQIGWWKDSEFITLVDLRNFLQRFERKEGAN